MRVIKGTPEQIEWAEKRYAKHRVACQRNNMLPDHKDEYVADCIRNFDAIKDIESYEWTDSNIAENATIQNYHQYQSPRSDI